MAAIQSIQSIQAQMVRFQDSKRRLSETNGSGASGDEEGSSQETPKKRRKQSGDCPTSQPMHFHDENVTTAISQAPGRTSPNGICSQETSQEDGSGIDPTIRLPASLLQALAVAVSQLASEARQGNAESDITPEAQAWITALMQAISAQASSATPLEQDIFRVFPGGIEPIALPLPMYQFPPAPLFDDSFSMPAPTIATSDALFVPPSPAPLTGASKPVLLPTGVFLGGAPDAVNAQSQTSTRQDPTVVASSSQITPQHAEILATKWLKSHQLAALAEKEGLVYKQGKFSSAEIKQLGDAITQYQRNHSLSEQRLEEIIFPAQGERKNTTFWSEITRAVPQRPLNAVYHHVRRQRHPMKGKGVWGKREDANLEKAYAELGPAWEQISLRVNRSASDCRDRHRNHIADRYIRVSGVWSKEEERELTQIVTKMTAEKGGDIDKDIFWTKVSQGMGGQRGPQQCRTKWTDSLSKLVKSDGANPPWLPQDAAILIDKVASLNVKDDTEIDWKQLPDSAWNLWSPHLLQRRWSFMKKSIEGYEAMSHKDIVTLLRVRTPLVCASPFPSIHRGDALIHGTGLRLDEIPRRADGLAEDRRSE